MGQLGDGGGDGVLHAEQLGEGAELLGARRGGGGERADERDASRRDAQAGPGLVEHAHAAHGGEGAGERGEREVAERQAEVAVAALDEDDGAQRGGEEQAGAEDGEPRERRGRGAGGDEDPAAHELRADLHDEVPVFGEGHAVDGVAPGDAQVLREGVDPVGSRAVADHHRGRVALAVDRHPQRVGSVRCDGQAAHGRRRQPSLAGHRLEAAGVPGVGRGVGLRGRDEEPGGGAGPEAVARAEGERVYAGLGDAAVGRELASGAVR